MASSPSSYSIHFTFFFTLTLFLLSLGFYFVNQKVHLSYMDEIFHVPQVQRYCQGQFHFWDPKITTPPGLYLLTWILFLVLPTSIFSCHDLITLRFISLCFAILLFPVLYALRHQLTHRLTLANEKYVGWNAFNLWLMPCSGFFYFFYYTDTLSTLLVLGSYYCAQKKYRWMSALIGAYSVLVRQSNLIWLAFIAGTVLLRQSGYRAQSTTSSWFTSHQDFITDLFSRFLSKLWLMFPFLVSMLTLFFLASIYGIVMGDQVHHELSFHLAQWNYFTALFCILTFPMFWNMSFLRSCFLRPSSLLHLLYFIVFSFLCVHLGTLVHPFILSDNRHLSFYVWRYFFQFYPMARYMYIPIYALAHFFLHYRLRISQSAVWTTLYYLAISFTLIPTPLLEFRYFILPLCLGRLHVFQMKPWQLLLESIVSLSLHVYVFYLFLWHPFVSEQEPGILQRFMW